MVVQNTFETLVEHREFAEFRQRTYYRILPGSHYLSTTDRPLATAAATVFAQWCVVNPKTALDVTFNLMRARCSSQQLFVYVYEPAKKKSQFRVTVVTVTPTLQTAK